MKKIAVITGASSGMGREMAFRWTFQFYDQSQTSAELADLLERISPYFLNGVQVFGVIVVEAVVFLALIALVYRRQEI